MHPYKPVNILRLALSAGALFVATNARAAITWGIPTTISGDSDVSSAGVVVQAINFGADASTDATTTINGITFTNELYNTFISNDSEMAGTGEGSLTISSAGYVIGGHPFDASQAPFGDLTAPYRNLLNSALWADGLDSKVVNIELGGLTAGRSYQIQLWVSDPRSYGINRDTTYTDVNAVTLDQNTASSGYGGLGQYVIGNFIASGATETIVASSSDSTNVSGYLLTTTVPEPSTWGLMAAVGALGFVMLRRRGVARGLPGRN